MKLSDKARKDLRRVLINDIGSKATSEMSDDDLDDIGNLLLTMLAEALKMKMNEKKKQ